jgi:TRAP-type mannitol/chloroaromatic compound transport system permease small subunit
MATETPESPQFTEYPDDGGNAVADVGATFAGVLLILTSFMEVLHGIAAVANGEIYSAGTDYLYRFNLNVWGTIHIVIGAASFVVAIGILGRARWGQIAGIVVASLSILSNFAFLPRYPWWSMLIIGFNVFVIWALTTLLRTSDR